jgi:biotin carboxyl carrier protein
MLRSMDIEKIIDDLDQLRRFTGSTGEFWIRYIKGCTRLVDADFGFLLVRDQGAQAWKPLCIWPSAKRSAIQNAEFVAVIEKAAERALDEGIILEDYVRGKSKGRLAGVRLDLGEERHVGVAVFSLPAKAGISDEELTLRLKLVSDAPLVYQMRRVADKAKNDVVRFVEALDLMVLLNEENSYVAAAMSFCNELASRFACSRISLGWLKDGYVRVQAISHMENFEKKMDAVQTLEAAMEEAFDQDEEVVYPPQDGSNTITRDHEAFAIEQGVKNMLSLPIRLDNEPVGVVTCERGERAFTENEISTLRLICDQAARRLGDLERHGRWIGARMWASIREMLSMLFGVEHTLAKSVGLIVTILLAVLLFGRWNYRIEAPFILKTDDLAFLPAPFDGYIHEVHVQVGDVVNEKDLLLSLDTGELLVEESAAIADQARYAGEAEKARARYALAEMKINEALRDQADAKLELIRYHLKNAEIRAPFAGIVVEGELKELQGAPVRKGDVLFKVARIEKMYAELDVDERDIHEIDEGREGEIAFVSMPDRKFPIRVEVINPVAMVKDEGNVFPARCRFTQEIEGWWRPGMSGIAKVQVGKRNILWIFTHRTVDFFRLLFWM